MTEAQRVTVERVISASPADIFAVLADPARHVEIDGSGMLEAAPDAAPLRAVGDTFDMDMDREPLGDLPMGKYKVRNHVTRIEADAEIEWGVGGVDRPPLGHVYGYALTAEGDDATRVTHYCDWTGIPDRYRERATWPIVPVHMLEATLANLARVVEGPGHSDLDG